ncbi:hypothetical protein DAPPUDRAFT_241248 [Daphnia pulex]|uniref:CUB domain-containing protein n=1 Tax=Daphnia pulex TaxID=6669 RepID=E9GDT1_DAPPU|nr:hypothetical protein DAPPUDRAFT_241248 [Daphnia pulex]|eukprot:EFX82425.1 hypothetical protein DAPPUDRAFT_241248 [Daphnia pulex]
MKLLGILALLIKAQQSTLKSTTSKTNATSTVKPKTTSSKVQTTTKINPTNTPKTNATTTSKITPKMNVTTTTSKKTTTTKKTSATTTLKPRVTTTVKRNVTTTTPSPANIPKFFVVGSVDYGYGDVVLNRDYYSIDNSLSVKTTFDYPDWFECKWTTLPQDNTTNFKLCRHADAKTANGKIEPLRGDTASKRSCFITIVAPSDHQIEMSCSSLNFSGYLSIDNKKIEDSIKYYSINNEMTLASSFGYQDWFNCSYKAIPKEITAESKFCRHAEATTANGTISPVVGDNRDSNYCTFVIKAADPYQQIRIVCSVILLTTPGVCRDNLIGSNQTTNGTIEPLPKMNKGELRACRATIRVPYDYQIQLSCSAINMSSDMSYLRIDGILDLDPNPLELNKVYFSDLSNEVTIVSSYEQSDWFYCKWKIALRETKSPNSQFCRDAISTAANGTVTSIAENTSRQCPFVIKAPPGWILQVICSNLSPDGSFQLMLKITGIIDYSRYEDFVFENLCSDGVATSSSGTIQPSTTDDAGPTRSCPFTIQTTSSDQQIQMSCSVVNLTSSVLNIYGVVDENVELVQNRIYTSSSYSNKIIFVSEIEYDDWIDCKWNITTVKNTTDYKCDIIVQAVNSQICRDSEARTANGTIQPLTGDPVGPLRKCYFRIKASLNEQIRISCSTIKLTSPESFLWIDGIIGTAYDNSRSDK